MRRVSVPVNDTIHRHAADPVVFTLREGRLHVLLIERGFEPFKGKHALPGGFLRAGETLEDTVHRVLQEHTALDAITLPLKLQQLRTYSASERDPRGRVVSTAFLAIAPDLPIPTAGSDARTAQWMEMNPMLRAELAFDHNIILSDALARARTQLEYTTIAAAFCGAIFTVAELRQVYEAIWGIKLDHANFHRKVVKSNSGFIEPIGCKRINGRGRPADLYRRGRARTLHQPIRRVPRPSRYRAAQSLTLPS